MTGKLLLCGAFALGLAFVLMSPPGQWLEREVGLEALYTVRGTVEPPPGARVVGLDRGSVGWLQRNVRDLDRAAPALDRCLSERARDVLAEARNVNHIPRGLYACLVRKLSAHRPELIAFDVNFNVEKPEDDAFAEAIRAAGNVILLDRVGLGGLRSPAESSALTVRLHPVKALREAALATAAFQVDGSRGHLATAYLRRFPEFPRLHALPEVAFQISERRELPQTLRDSPTQLIWMYGPPGTVPTHLLRDIFDVRSARPLPETLEGTVVFVGASDPTHGTVDDHFRVPTIAGDRSLVGGVELAATAYLNILHGETLSAAPAGTHVALMVVFGFALAAVALLAGNARQILIIIALTLGYATLAAASFAEARLWLPSAVPVIVAMPAAILMALENRYRLASGLVVRLAPRPFAERLLRTPDVHRHEPQTEQATVLFTDVVNSVALGERMPELAFAGLMSAYYDGATKAIEDNGGMIVDYRGDGILAVFTESVAGRDHPARACRAALTISAFMGHSGARDEAERQRRLQLRMGLNTGTVVTGTVGARDRFNYNALGDNVHVADRLEKLGKQFAIEAEDVIIVSDATRESAALADDYFEHLGDVQLRGRESTTSVFRLREPAKAL